MKDRQVQFPSRYRLVKVPGTDDIFDLTPAPGAVDEEGTLVNKSTLLKDATAALYGLGTEAVPDEVLALLGPYMQYWWKRREASWTAVISYFTSGSMHICEGSSQAACTNTVQYSDAIDFGEHGEFSLRNPQSLTIAWSGGATTAAVLAGKYVLGTAAYPDKIIYFSENAKFSTNSSSSSYYVKTDSVTQAAMVVASMQITGNWQYIQSSERGAYPDSGIVDGYQYLYVGVPLHNAVNPSRIETGSYVGTGTVGEENPTSLVFEEEPLAIIFTYVVLDTGETEQLWHGEASSASSTGEESSYWIGYPPQMTTTFTVYQGFGYAVSGVHPKGKISEDRKTISWYTERTDAREQFNQKGWEYHYIAIYAR